jgi:hypothetical protein
MPSAPPGGLQGSLAVPEVDLTGQAPEPAGGRDGALDDGHDDAIDDGFEQVRGNPSVQPTLTDDPGAALAR